MRASCRRLVLEGILYAPQQIACLPVLAQDISPDDFHKSCIPGLYEPVVSLKTFGKCHRLYHRRIITSLPCTYAKKTLLVPFLVDTGAPRTYLHSIALDKFNIDRTTLEHKVHVNETPLTVLENTCSDGRHVLSHLNVLGMDFLDEAVPDMIAFFTQQFSKMKPLSEVIVTDGNVTFLVKPERMQVMCLKDAITEKMKYALPSPMLTIKTPDGEVLGDEADLVTGVKYTYVHPT